MAKKRMAKKKESLTEYMNLLRNRQDDWQEWRGPIPKSVPVGRIIMHNPVVPVRKNQAHGYNGFRVYTLPEEELTGGTGYWHDLVLCKCGWAGVPHYVRKKWTEEIPAFRDGRG